MKKAVMFVCAVSAFAATPAFAQAYVGVLGGYDNVELEYDGESGNKDGVMYGIVAGYDASVAGAVVGVEAELSDSEVSDSSGDVLVAGDMFKLSAGRDVYVGVRAGFKATDHFLVYAKGGYTSARAKLTYDDGIDVYSESDTLNGYRIGAGLEYKAGPMGVRAEYRFSDYGEYSYDGIGTGLEARRSQVVAAFTFGF